MTKEMIEAQMAAQDLLDIFKQPDAFTADELVDCLDAFEVALEQIEPNPNAPSIFTEGIMAGTFEEALKRAIEKRQQDQKKK